MTAEQLKNSILQMAVQGKLVPQDPNDEPASELIKRIREEKERLIKEGNFYEEENLLSFDNVVEDLQALCRRNGGTI
jgi:type I restriction enzyme S subunit